MTRLLAAIVVSFTSITTAGAGEKLTLDDALTIVGKCRAQGVRPMDWLDGSHYLAFDTPDAGGDRMLVSVDALGFVHIRICYPLVNNRTN